MGGVGCAVMRPVHVVGLRPSRDLCGTTEDQFADLLIRLAPLAQERLDRLADRPDRQRAPGAGRKRRPFWVRLLVALTHLRQGSTVRATGDVFGVHEKTVRRYRDEIEELLVEHGFVPPGAARPIRTLDELADYLTALAESDGEEAVVVDGTEVARCRPYPWDEQKKAYSGKSKTHVVKATVVSNRSRRPLWVEANPTGEGRTFDVMMLRHQTALMAALAVLVAAGIIVIADKGFRGLGQDLGADSVLMPKRKPSGADYPPETRAFNKAVSQQRMPVEHAIGRMKWWKAMRYWRRHPHHFDRTAKAIGVLATLT